LSNYYKECKVSRLTIVRKHAISLAVLGLVIGIASSALAIPPEQVLHVDGPIAIAGDPCCFSFNETISMTEPAKPVAIVVTFEESGESDGAVAYLVGLIVNNRACKFFGSGFIPGIIETDTFQPRTFQWIVFPDDGLRKGRNTLTLCGGSAFFPATVTFRSFTLGARLSN